MSAKNRGDRIVELIRENTELRFRLHGMIRTNADLIKRIEEDQAVYEQVINERCAGDEQHCTCVPHLRRRITELETQLAALQHEYLVVVTSRAHARAEWERLEKENARLELRAGVAEDAHESANRLLVLAEAERDALREENAKLHYIADGHPVSEPPDVEAFAIVSDGLSVCLGWWDGRTWDAGEDGKRLPFDVKLWWDLPTVRPAPPADGE